MGKPKDTGWTNTEVSG